MLPEMAVHKSLLKLNILIIKYPKIFPRMLYSHIGANYMYYLILAAIQTANTGNGETLRRCADAYFWGIVFFCFVLLFVFEFLVRQVESVLRQATQMYQMESADTGTGTLTELKAMKQVLKGYYYFRFVFYPGVVGAMINASFAVAFQGRYNHFFFNLEISIASLAMSAVCVVLFIFTDGSLAPKQTSS